MLRPYKRLKQERETEIEVEAVRQVKKPMSYTPLKFPGLHRDLETFARTARIPAGSDIFVHVMRALARTALGRKHKVNHEVSSSQLFVSSEFERTVKLVFEAANDNFLVILPYSFILLVLPLILENSALYSGFFMRLLQKQPSLSRPRKLSI